MVTRSILVPLAFRPTLNEVTGFALKLAAHFNAHLLAHHVRQQHDYYPPVDFYAIGDGTIAQVMRSHETATQEFAQELKTAFEAQCEAAGAHLIEEADALQQNGVTASWHVETGSPPNAYAYAARTADLVVMAIPDAKDNALERDVFQTVLFQSGAPVLLIPRDGLDTVPSRPLVAWDGSLQASRSIRSAMPFLGTAEKATLLGVGEPEDGAPVLERAKHWLERSGVKVEARSVDWPHGPVAERILNQCEATNSDLVVMGGYSHAPWRESMVGGVTRDMLRHGKLPILIVH